MLQLQPCVSIPRLLLIVANIGLTELGHIRKNCPEDPNEIERPEIKCFLCDSVGHRMRDCTEERVDKFACKNCRKSGHSAKEVRAVLH